MAPEEVSEEVQTNPLHIDEAELDALENEFGGETEEPTNEFAEDEDEDPLAEEDGEGDEQEEGGKDEDVDRADSEDRQDDDKPDDEETSEGDEDAAQEGYELVVDGQSVLVDTEEELAAWAQKGIHYERKQQDLERRVENSEFTVNAILKDPLNSILELWTANEFGGNYEQARFQMRQLVENWLDPVWKEELAKPHERAAMQQQRMQSRHQRTQQQQQAQLDSSFTQEDIDFIQNMDVHISEALRESGLPAENKNLRQRMAQVMRDGVDRGIQPDPRAAVQFIKSQQEELSKALGNTPTPRDGKKSGKSSDPAAIKAAKNRRSKSQKGKAPRKGGRRRKEPQYITAREFMTGINDKLGVDF